MKTIKGFKKLAIAATLGLGASMSYADPTVIDFDGATSGSISLVPVQVGDYIFTVDSGNGYLADGNNVIESGNMGLLGMGDTTTITMTMDGGGAFSLLGVDVGGSYIGYSYLWASMLSVTSGAGSFLSSIGDSDSYQYLDLSGEEGFNNVTSITFTGVGGGLEYTLDNFNVVASVVAEAPNASVPEPGTLGVLAACLIGLGLMRRRKTA